MPISHSHRCIFVHIPKCAGTSIESALEMHGARKDVGIVPQHNQTVDEEHLWGAGAQHWTAAEIRDRVGRETFASYFKFAFVRNPWDRLASHLAWGSTGDKARWSEGEAPKKREFIERIGGLIVARATRKPVHRHLLEQWRYLCDDDGRLLVDFVGKFENLSDDWSEACRRMHVDAPLEHRMVSKHDKYTTYYNPVTAGLIGLLYRKDARMFGYRYGA